MKNIFIIGYVWPEPTASAAGIRMLQLIRFFREQDFEVHFGTPAMPSKHRFDLSRMGVHTHDFAVNDDVFNKLIAKINPGVVMFDRYMMEEQFSWRVAEHCPQAIRILNTEDLHFLRKFRESFGEYESGVPATQLKEFPLAKRELAAIYRSDLSLIISEEETKLLQEVFAVPASLLAYHPLFAEDSLRENREELPSFQNRKDVMMIGNFLHAPNVDAVKVLEEGLWKDIQQELPGVNLHIYGAYMPEHLKMRKSAAKGILYHGRAEDVNVVMQQHRLCIAPLRFGAGLKGKLIRAMENGLPSVTTPIGAEGVSGNLEWGGQIASLPLQFREAVITLYTQESVWKDAVDRGFKIVDSRFRREVFEKQLMARINALMIDLRFHRAGNFTGMMLLDQRCMAARYLSKYIMAKNKK